MNKPLRNLAVILGFGLLIFLLWYFRNIVAYILIAGVLSLVGRPLVDLFNSIHIKRISFPKALSALLTLIILWGLILLFFVIFIPVISAQVKTLSTIDSRSIVILGAATTCKT